MKTSTELAGFYIYSVLEKGKELRAKLDLVKGASQRVHDSEAAWLARYKASADLMFARTVEARLDEYESVILDLYARWISGEPDVGDSLDANIRSYKYLAANYKHPGAKK